MVDFPPTTRSGPDNRQESVRDIYLADDPADAATLVDKAIIACTGDEVPEIQALGRTLSCPVAG